MIEDAEDKEERKWQDRMADRGLDIAVEARKRGITPEQIIVAAYALIDVMGKSVVAHDFSDHGADCQCKEAVVDMLLDASEGIAYLLRGIEQGAVVLSIEKAPAGPDERVN